MQNQYRGSESSEANSGGTVIEQRCVTDDSSSVSYLARMRIYARDEQHNFQQNRPLLSSAVPHQPESPETPAGLTASITKFDIPCRFNRAEFPHRCKETPGKLSYFFGCQIQHRKGGILSQDSEWYSKRRRRVHHLRLPVRSLSIKGSFT